ncbi:dTDP-4-dehydrorhamnose 3,5-epimerase [Paenibacillus sp. KS-LC4]|uniref:dTDP-4-dehydrorhamnose 3,5-epimerase family protein n=1 Tax=Paenibacillus sp. KS-LC4 TaxID=2979727 RepID=UPI0030D5C2ED
MESYFDVVVDIRRNSPTFGQWIGELLSFENKRKISVHVGSAHGFCTLQPNTQVHYKVDEFYSSDYDRAIRWDDVNLGINWPTRYPILSIKDQRHPLLTDAELI